MTQPVPPRPDIPPDPDGKAITPVTWRAIEALPVLLIALVGAVLLSVPISLTESCSAQNVLFALVSEVAYGGTVIWWVVRFKRTPVRALGAPRQPWRDVGIGLLVGLALVVVAGIVLTMVRAVATEIVGHAPEDPDQVATCVRGIGLALLGPIVIVAAPLGEELFFRGFLYQGLRRRFRVWSAVAISSIFFGFVHVAGATTGKEFVSFLLIVPSLTAVGVGLALVFEQRHSLLASVSAHAAFNAVGYVAIVLSR